MSNDPYYIDHALAQASNAAELVINDPACNESVINTVQWAHSPHGPRTPMPDEHNLCATCKQPRVWARVDGPYDSYGLWMCLEHEIPANHTLADDRHATPDGIQSRTPDEVEPDDDEHDPAGY